MKDRATSLREENVTVTCVKFTVPVIAPALKAVSRGSTCFPVLHSGLSFRFPSMVRSFTRKQLCADRLQERLYLRLEADLDQKITLR
jgi:hypothetical protein